MKNKLIKLVPGRDFRYHLEIWLFIYALSLAINLIGKYTFSIPGYTAMFLLAIACFYLLVDQLKRRRAPGGLIPIALAVLLVFICMAALGISLVYVLLPYWFGIYLYDRSVVFHLGEVVQQVYRNFLPILIAAIAAYHGLLSAGKSRQLLESERRRAEAMENQLKMERLQRKTLEENLRMQSSLLTNQRGTHWLHSIFNQVKASLTHDEAAARVVEAYIFALRYAYIHGGVEQRLVLLDVELQFIRAMLYLNAVAVPGGVAIVMDIAPILVAREIPPLLFGTAVENALRHGEQHDVDNPIRIELSSTPDCLRFYCWNKKNKAIDAAEIAESTGVGLANIQRQLDLTFPGRHAVNIEDKEEYYGIEILIFY